MVQKKPFGENKEPPLFEIKIGCDRTQNFTLSQRGGVIPSRV